MKKTIIFLQAAIISCAAFADWKCDYENYNGQDLSNQVFDGKRNSNLYYRYTTWVGANLSNSQFGIVLGTYPNQHGQEVYLTGADFTNANLTGVSFGCEPIGGYSARAYFDDAIFTNSYITYANFYGASGFTKEQLYSTASYKNKDLTGINLVHKNLSDWDFSGQNLTYVNFGSSTLTGANFTDAIISNAKLGTANKEQIYSTKSYKEKNLRGVELPNVSGWDLSAQNLMLSKIINYGYASAGGGESTNFTKSDLRGATLGQGGELIIYKNTIWLDGEIKNFSMESADDSLTIRKYVPATAGGATINAKLVDDATISGGAVLTLEQGAVLEIASGKTLSVLDDSEIIFNVDAAASDATKVLLGENSKLAFGSDSKITINLEGVVSEDDPFSFSVVETIVGSQVLGTDSLKKENVILNVNGEEYDSSKWTFDFDSSTGALNINVNVPEPAEWAMILGAIAIAFAAYRRRK